MAKLNIENTRTLLQDFAFHRLFVEELGWEQPSSSRKQTLSANDFTWEQRQIAKLSGIVVLEISMPDAVIPDARMRKAVHKEIAKLHHENLLIFVDGQRSQSLWYWVKREQGKEHPREHFYSKGQPGDLFLSKLSALVIDLSELDAEGRLPVTEAARRLKAALDVERVTKKFFGEFQQQHIQFLDLITGIADERDRRWYASVLLNRLMFIYFLQKKHFLNGGDERYLQNKLAVSKARQPDVYYKDFLRLLFFEGFAKPREMRSAEANAVLGEIKYLNGGLFLEHRIELENSDIQIPDQAFENLFGLFERYSWSLNDAPGGKDDEINPDVLGYIFEKYINQKAFGAYYTRPEITDYLCEQTIHKLILARVNELALPPLKTPASGNLFPQENTGLFLERRFDSMADLLMNLDGTLCRRLWKEILPELTLLDPACGSGAFLVAAMKTLINVYSAVIGRVEFTSEHHLKRELEQLRDKHHGALDYFIKKRIITDNLFGVDLMEEATEIAKLRLFLALVASAQTVEQLEPLPNIDFNILAGNSLIGLMRVDDAEFEKRHAQGNLFQQKTYRQLLEEKNRAIRLYRQASAYSEDLRNQRDHIESLKRDAAAALNDMLLVEFQKLGIKYEEATWDKEKDKEGKPKKRPVGIRDIEALHPFHWGYEFDEIINQRGGFDAIIANPPWETFKPQAKEFFAEYSELVTKNKMTFKEFEKEQDGLLKKKEIRDAWLEYQSRFPHLSAWYRNAPQYKNQTSIVNGKKAGSDINLYKLFLEQSFSLLRPQGRCGIILQSGIYTDLGTKQLREMLFSESQISSMFGLSNERFIFENVHHAQKFCILVFGKGGQTDLFRAAFRINPREAISSSNLRNFLNSPSEHIQLPVSLIRRLSPDSLSVMEFKNEMDVSIAEKMLRFPLLGEKIESKWNVTLARELDVTQGDNSNLVFPTPGKAMTPLYEGKMIWQFDHHFAEAKIWASPKELRKVLLGKNQRDEGQIMNYQVFRLVFRRQSASTNERTLVTTIIPPAIHADNMASLVVVNDAGEREVSDREQAYLCALLNSFVVDFVIKQRVTNNLNFFFLYQLPIPRLTEQDKEFAPIVERAAKLICTTPEFDDLAREVGLGDHSHGVTDEAGRAQLRAELDGMIAHLYGLTEEEFAYILTTFPLVADSVKAAALVAYRAFAPNPDDQAVAALLRDGESARVEFKLAARWNPHTNKKDDTLKDNIIQAVASFRNSREGGALFIGVNNQGEIKGLAEDYQATNPQRPGRDTYELFLRDLLGKTLGGEHGDGYQISFHTLDGQDLCRIAVQPAAQPVYLGGELYVRLGNRKEKLTTQAALAYCRERWPKAG